MTPAESLAELKAKAPPADPLARVLALKGKPERFLETHRLVRDRSFLAALHVDRASFDQAVKLLRSVGGISKDAVVEEYELFVQQLRRPADPKTSSTAPAAPPPELTQKAEELLRDPNLLGRYHASLARDGVVGERKATTTLLLMGVTRMTKRPVHGVVKAPSSGGKNWAVKHVVDLFPPGDVIEITDMSPKALQYLPTSLKQKIVVITEHEGTEGAEYVLRVAMSEGSLSTLTATKVSDEDGSHIESHRHVVEGPACFITTTTRAQLHDENETRVLEVTLDESQEQTKRINNDQALRAKHPPSRADEEQAAAERDVWRCALGMLDATEAVNPFAPKLADSFPTARVRARRDFQRLLDLIAAHALLHQRQRQRDLDGRVVVEEQDVVVVQKLCTALFSSTSPRLRTTATKLWGIFRVKEFTPAQAAKVLGYDIDAARRLLHDLEDAELVQLVQQSRGAKASKWTLAGEPDCPTEPDFDDGRTNSAETTGETPEPDCPTADVGGVNGTGADPPGAGDQPVDPQPPTDPGRTVGQTNSDNDSGQLTPTEAKVGQGRAVGQDGAPESKPSAPPPPSSPLSPPAPTHPPVNGSKAADLIIEVLGDESEEAADSRHQILLQLREAPNLTAVVKFLVEEMDLQTEEAVLAECQRLQSFVPPLQRVGNLPHRIGETYRSYLKKRAEAAEGCSP